MVNRTLVDHIEEHHPWPPYIPQGAEKLFLGTFPTAERNRGDVDFFYPNPNNQFWKVLRAIDPGPAITAAAFEADPEVQRKGLLNRLDLGIGDMGRTVLRHEKSSLDSSLFIKEYTDIFELLSTPDGSGIRKIIFGSSTGANSALGWFKGYCKLNRIRLPKLTGKNPKRNILNWNGRRIELVTVHSTSRAAAKDFDELVAMYREELV